MVLDPVCHMGFEVCPDTPRAVYRGRTFYFCSHVCAAKFRANPARYATPAPTAAR